MLPKSITAAPSCLDRLLSFYHEIHTSLDLEVQVFLTKFGVHAALQWERTVGLEECLATWRNLHRLYREEIQIWWWDGPIIHSLHWSRSSTECYCLLCKPPGKAVGDHNARRGHPWTWHASAFGTCSRRSCWLWASSFLLTISSSSFPPDCLHHGLGPLSKCTSLTAGSLEYFVSRNHSGDHLCRYSKKLL